jgi:hypothetical protein
MRSVQRACSATSVCLRWLKDPVNPDPLLCAHVRKWRPINSISSGKASSFEMSLIMIELETRLPPYEARSLRQPGAAQPTRCLARAQTHILHLRRQILNLVWILSWLVGALHGPGPEGLSAQRTFLVTKTRLTLEGIGLKRRCSRRRLHRGTQGVGGLGMAGSG